VSIEDLTAKLAARKAERAAAKVDRRAKQKRDHMRTRRPGTILRAAATCLAAVRRERQRLALIPPAARSAYDDLIRHLPRFDGDIAMYRASANICKRAAAALDDAALVLTENVAAFDVAIVYLRKQANESLAVYFEKAKKRTASGLKRAQGHADAFRAQRRAIAEEAREVADRADRWAAKGLSFGGKFRRVGDKGPDPIALRAFADEVLRDAA
jgi:hypothetical protein